MTVLVTVRRLIMILYSIYCMYIGVLNSFPQGKQKQRKQAVYNHMVHLSLSTKTGNTY